MTFQEARQKEAEIDGYRKAEIFEFNVYQDGGDLQVKLQNIEWMNREANEKDLFNVSMLLCFMLHCLKFISSFAVKTWTIYLNGLWTY